MVLWAYPTRSCTPLTVFIYGILVDCQSPRPRRQNSDQKCARTARLPKQFSDFELRLGEVVTKHAEVRNGTILLHYR